MCGSRSRLNLLGATAGASPVVCMLASCVFCREPSIWCDPMPNVTVRSTRCRPQGRPCSEQPSGARPPTTSRGGGGGGGGDSQSWRPAIVNLGPSRSPGGAGHAGPSPPPRRPLAVHTNSAEGSARFPAAPASERAPPLVAAAEVVLEGEVVTSSGGIMAGLHLRKGHEHQHYQGRPTPDCKQPLDDAIARVRAAALRSRERLAHLGT